MTELSCHCGQIRVQVDKRPDYINQCNCTLCSKTGARWGYFHPSAVSVLGETKRYRRQDKDVPSVDVHFCPTCGSTTHFTLTESAKERFGDTLLGVNMGLADDSDLAGIELRFPDGRAWSGQGEFGYRRGARLLGDEEVPE